MKEVKIKRFKTRSCADARGVAIFPFELKSPRNAIGGGDIRNFHVVTMKPGSVRGNHSHPHHEEYILCAGGTATLITQKKGRKESCTIENELVKVGRNIPHAIANRGDSDLFIICFYGSGKGERLTRVPVKLA